MAMPAHHPPTNPKSPFGSMAAHHVAIRVPDYQRTKDWYTSKLDFRVVHEWPYGDLELAYLAPAADNKFHLEILGGTDPTPKIVFDDLGESLGVAGYHHFCMNVDSVDETLVELRRRAVTIIGEPFDLPAISRRLGFFADLWGNMIELAEVLPEPSRQ
jgi:lactoylglutathione lyase/glyoxylase I family protein